MSNSQAQAVTETDTEIEAAAWWMRPDLAYAQDHLTLAGHDLERLARASGMPAFFYNAERVRTKLMQVDAALHSTGLPHRIFYAMKANRFAPLLGFIRSTGLAGIDACSPQELQFALSCGFQESDISYTATSVSNADLDVLARHPNVHINLDSLSSLRRLAARCPGRSIGLRINPAQGVSYGDNALLNYSGTKTTKFGIYREQWAEALQTVRELGLKLSAIHFHVGIGYQTAQLPLWEQIVQACAEFIDDALAAEHPLERINLGGGLGLPHGEEDVLLDLNAWAGVIRRQLGPERFQARILQIAVEPGDFVVKDAGVLVLQANTVERKRETTFVGLDGGFNLAMEPAFYSLPCAPVPCLRREGSIQLVTLAGNINEALDIWARDVALSPIEEGDYIALINAGGYASAMSSNHCMRGQFYERLLFPTA
jgi:diaminopimelate decarboxylase